jgi:hypothetical protein
VSRRAKGALIVLLLCVAADFVLGYIRHRSVQAGILHIFGGLLSTAFFLLLYWLRTEKDKDGGAES